MVEDREVLFREITQILEVPFTENFGLGAPETFDESRKRLEEKRKLRDILLGKVIGRRELLSELRAKIKRLAEEKAKTPVPIVPVPVVVEVPTPIEPVTELPEPVEKFITPEEVEEVPLTKIVVPEVAIKPPSSKWLWPVVGIGAGVVALVAIFAKRKK